MDAFVSLASALQRQEVRFVLIGVGGANLYATSGGTVFTTQDRDLLLPLDPHNLLGAWHVCESEGLSLWCVDEPLDQPRDQLIAQAVVDRHMAVRATDGRGLEVDFTLTMAGFDFETVWAERRVFVVDGVEIPVARLTHIVRSKAAAGRPKDRLFLATHADALAQMLGSEE